MLRPAGRRPAACAQAVPRLMPKAVGSGSQTQRCRGGTLNRCSSLPICFSQPVLRRLVWSACLWLFGTIFVAIPAFVDGKQCVNIDPTFAQFTLPSCPVRCLTKRLNFSAKQQVCCFPIHGRTGSRCIYPADWALQDSRTFWGFFSSCCPTVFGSKTRKRHLLHRGTMLIVASPSGGTMTLVSKYPWSISDGHCCMGGCSRTIQNIYSLRHAAGHQLEPALAGRLMMLIHSQTVD